MQTENYRRNSLCAAYKSYTKKIQQRIRPVAEASLSETENGFRKRDPVQLMEKHCEYNTPTYIASVDFEKAFDRVDRSKLFQIMLEKRYHEHLVRAI